MRAVPSEGGSMKDSREFLTANPTPCTRCSSGAFPYYKGVYSFSFRLPLNECLVSCSAAMSISSLLSSRLMTAVFLELSTCCRSSVRPGYMVLTFQVASQRWWLCFSSSFFAWCRVYSLLFGVDPELQAPIESGKL